jgi:hypothetical protein
VGLSDEVVLAAVKQNGLALQFAAHGAASDQEVVMEAVRQNGRALFWADPERQADKTIVLEAVRQHGLALADASEDLRSDPDVVLEAVRHTPAAIEYTSPALFFIDRSVFNGAVASCLATPGSRCSVYNVREINVSATSIHTVCCNMAGLPLEVRLGCDGTLGDLARCIVTMRHELDAKECNRFVFLVLPNNCLVSVWDFQRKLLDCAKLF